MSKNDSPCKWHEGEEPGKPLIGCQQCSRPYPMKTCPGCGMEFIDWEAPGDPDVFVKPYVTSSGDLFCEHCGPEMDREDVEDYCL